MTTPAAVTSSTLTALDQALATAITKAVSGLDQAATFLAAEIPDVIRQLLIWKATVSGLMFMGCILITCAWAYIMKTYIWVQDEDGKRYWADEWNSPGQALMVSGVALTGAAALFDVAWLQILVAPKIYLIEYAAKFIN